MKVDNPDAETLGPPFDEVAASRVNMLSGGGLVLIEEPLGDPSDNPSRVLIAKARREKDVRRALRRKVVNVTAVAMGFLNSQHVSSSSELNDPGKLSFRNGGGSSVLIK